MYFADQVFRKASFGVVSYKEVSNHYSGKSLVKYLVIVEVIIIVDGELLQLPKLEVALLRLSAAATPEQQARIEVLARGLPRVPFGC